MSRFVEILDAHEREISVETFQRMLREMVDAARGRRRPHRDDASRTSSRRRRRSPGVESLMDYEVTLHRRDPRRRGESFTMKVVVPVTSLCPCSKKISERGAHNQRSHVTITARCSNDFVLDRGDRRHRRGARPRASSTALLKRPDEKYVTERAYDNPKFVEDLVRDVALRAERRRAHRRLRGRVGELRVDPQPHRLRAHRARLVARGSAVAARRAAPATPPRPPA